MADNEQSGPQPSDPSKSADPSHPQEPSGPSPENQIEPARPPLPESPQPESTQPAQVPPTAPALLDPEHARQFEQFRQFQQFQDFQRFQQAQGQLPPGSQLATQPPGTPPPPSTQRPLWFRILRSIVRSKLFRKLVSLLIILLVLSWAYDYYFGQKDDANRGQPQEKIAPNRLATNPGSAIYRLYNSIAEGSTDVCFYFDDKGKAAFARDFSAPTCEEAVRQLAGKVDPFPTDFIRQAPGADQRAEISSCAAHLQAGTTPLGLFVLTEPLPGEWLISDHRNEPSPCPSSSPSSAPGTSTNNSNSTQDSPANTVQRLYVLAAGGDALGACGLFTAQGQANFAASFGTSSCGEAVRKLRINQKDTYAKTLIPSDAVQVGNESGQATVASCGQVQGGPALGSFTLTRVNNEWKISGHEKCQ